MIDQRRRRTPLSGLIRERRGESVAWLTLNRPDRLNAMSRELLTEFGEELAELAADDTVRVLVLAGTGRAFCAGADVADFEAVSTDDERERYLREALEVYWSLAEWPKPTIAAVDGLALGGGCELAMACDLVVAGPVAEFGLPEVSLGALPSFALTYGQRRVGPGGLALLALARRRIGPSQARELGLVDVVAGESARSQAEALAAEIATGPPVAMEKAKHLIRNGGGIEAAVEASVTALASEEHTKAVEAFRAKAKRA